MSNQSDVIAARNPARPTTAAACLDEDGSQLANVSVEIAEPAREDILSEQTTEEWTQQGILELHGVLYDTCVEKLGDPETPLDEVLDWLRWIFSAPEREHKAFSFATCLKLYQRPNPRALRESILAGVKRYLAQRLAMYPDWVAGVFWGNPDWFADQLERDPQWLNEQLRKRNTNLTPDLFH